jgi:non-ribosomal peptide synthetase-like protein
VTGLIPAGERWAGTRAQQIPGDAARWPGQPAPRSPRWRFWQGMYGVGLGVHTAQQMLIAAPGLAVTYAVLPSQPRLQDWVVTTLELAPALAALYLLTEILVLSGLFRAASRLLRPGWHPATGGAAWAVWFTQSLLEGALLTVFPLYASIYTRGFLRLLGVRVGPRTEISHAVTMNRLVTVGATSFAADDVGFLTNRCRGGWLHLAPIEVGSGSFLGNGALLRDDNRTGDRTLVGVLSSAPGACPDGTSWFGYPALELPRVPEVTDPARTIAPPRSLVAARGAIELVRILLPSSVSMVLAVLLITAMEAIGNAFGLVAMVALAAPLMLAAGLAATAFTVAAKWTLIGRYRPGKHPLWSSFVWRDEIINSCQEQLAGFWLLDVLLGTPLMPWYLRAMGARVGSDVWFETLCVTEFDVVNIGDGCVINRGVHVETHLFHDRVMSIGPTYLGDGATLGPTSAVLPDTVVGAGCVLGARSVVLRGEELPPGTRWHGAPVVAVQS